MYKLLKVIKHKKLQKCKNKLIHKKLSNQLINYHLINKQTICYYQFISPAIIIIQQHISKQFQLKVFIFPTTIRQKYCLYNTLKSAQSKFLISISIVSPMSPPDYIVASKMLKLYVLLLVVLALFIYLNPTTKKPSLYQINRETHSLLHTLIQTKYFRMIRVNLNRQCELWVRNKICKSKSCTVCRCDEKDIPTNWIKTDKVNMGLEGKDLWETQRDSTNNTINWIWHVQDEQNDQGQYFDLYSNVESFTNYDGKPIWKLVYQENCFNVAKANKTEPTCKQQAVFYKVISGLHTSISTHISMMHKNITPDAQVWAGFKHSEEFFVSHDQYRRRVLDHPQRVENLLFIYQIYLRAMKQIAQYVLHNYTIASDNIVQDLKTTQVLHQLSKKFQHYELRPFDAELGTFFYPQNPKVQLYQRYIHNISRLMNCVQCEKCRLFGKMQTYGIGTALKILLGYNAFYKRNEMVALFNAWNKISMSVDFYFQTVGAPKEEVHHDWAPLRLFAAVFGALIVVCFIFEHFKIHLKLKGVPKSEKEISQKKLVVQQKLNPEREE